MEQRTMEIVLKYYRRKYKLSQEEICDGICSVTTLSRLEQGYREIDSLVGQALLGRIGREVTLFETILNEEDLGLWKIRTEIEGFVENKQFKQVIGKIEEYRKVIPEDVKVHEQYCLYQEAILMVAEKKTIEKISEVLEKGIKISISDFNEKDEKRHLYNPMEIEMILMLFHYDESKDIILEQELLKILEHVKKYYSGKKKEELGTRIYLELIYQQEKAQNDEKLMFYSEEIIQFINEGEGFHHLADIYFLRAKTRERMLSGKENQGEYKKECLKECKMAFVLYQTEDNEKRKNEVEKFCEEKLECQITEPEISSV